MDIPKNWRHKSGYHLNADGTSIEYEHIGRQLLAIVEAMVDETEDRMQYYTVIYDTDGGVWDEKVAHEFWSDKDTAMENLRMHMEYYS